MAPITHSRFSRSRAARNAQNENTQKLPEFAIPYFSHQQLDPKRYSLGVGLPVGKPGWAAAPKEIATNKNGGWVDIVDENPYKRLKVTGGRPAMAKKVTANLDSDDELIVRMKNAKYLEKDIAQCLIDEGRVAYHPKTIGTRWARLRKVLEQRQDELLDADMTDWHEGDDEVLEQAIRRSDEIVAKVKSDADNRKWQIVADQMKRLKPVVSFSRNACRARYESLQSRMAKPTPESIENPTEEVLRRIQSRRERERLIDEDKLVFNSDPASLDNIEGNGWTSKQNKYF